ncbi:MAG: DUF523 domain-containing protein [Gammaproteobacteria bacterium]|nr:DUF523 domain-containing protein [Gammaproteobacteria bacterium]
MPNKLLISSCLLGQAVRYDGKSKAIPDIEWLVSLQEKGLLYPICPEVSGGLPVPRPAAEIQRERVITTTGLDVTGAFKKGAESALTVCQKENIKFALLKANSPSCGNRQIYDGSYSGTLAVGQGITAQLLSEHGIKVFSELEVNALKNELMLNQ